MGRYWLIKSDPETFGIRELGGSPDRTTMWDGVRNYTARNNLAIVYEKKPEWRDLAIEQWQQLMELCERNNDEKHVERARKHLAVLQTR